MATPNIESGIVETNKPRSYGFQTVWRWENALVAGAVIATPIFDVGRDGFPQAPVGQLRIVRVPSPDFRLMVSMSSNIAGNPGGQLKAVHFTDNGFALSGTVTTFYVQPRSMSSGPGPTVFFRYHSMGRRVGFQLVNTPLGKVAAFVQTYRLEVSVEG